MRGSLMSIQKNGWQGGLVIGQFTLLEMSIKKASLFLSLVYFPQYSEKNVPQFYSMHHIFHTDCPGRESGPQWDDITL